MTSPGVPRLLSHRLFLLLSALCLALLAPAGCDRGDHPQNLAKRAPQFAISDGQETLDLASLRGKVVVLNLWATWCAPCVQELPSLLALHQQMPELAIVAVSIDQNAAVYQKFLADHRIDFTSVRDPDQRINALYGTVQIPETYVIDQRGVLRRKFVDAQNWTSPEIMRYLQHLQERSS